MKIINLILLLSLSIQIQSQNIISLKERATVIENIQKDRFDNLLPKLMKETGIDMWILITMIIFHSFHYLKFLDVLFQIFLPSLPQ